jgi:hypothetical protein
VANSALTIATRMGMDVTLLCPTPDYVLDQRYMDWATQNVAESGGSLSGSATTSQAAYRGADVVYAKSWGALPYFGNWAQRSRSAMQYKHFIVDEAKMALTNNGVFSHCLPLRRNVKATDAVMDSKPASPSTKPRTDCMCRRRSWFRALVISTKQVIARNVNQFQRNDSPDSKDIVLAFSGGLDTSFCIPYLQGARLGRAHRVRRYRRRGRRGAPTSNSARPSWARPRTAPSTAGRRSGRASSSPSCGRARATKASIRCWCRIAI